MSGQATAFPARHQRLSRLFRAMLVERCGFGRSYQAPRFVQLVCSQCCTGTLDSGTARGGAFTITADTIRCTGYLPRDVMFTSAPQVLEPSRCQRGVTHRALDRAVAEIALHSVRVLDRTMHKHYGRSGFSWGECFD